jgi:uncharacterized protein (DUF488 family)
VPEQLVIATRRLVALARCHVKLANHRDAASVLTIGHSNHPLDRFLGLLRQHEIEVLVDVRSYPASRFSPHFSRNALDRAVTLLSIGYLFMGDALGGRPSARECYDAEGRVDYDRIEAQPFYQRGIEQLLDGIARFRVCVMCAEEDPSHCHRRLLIARTLVQRGVDVLHVRKTGSIETEQELRARPHPKQLSLPAEGGRPGERTRR